MSSTVPRDALSHDEAKKFRALRRVFVGALVLVLLIGTLGLLGVRTATVSTAAQGYELTVTYAQVTRPGLATPFAIEVTNDGGFDSGFTLETTSSFLDSFDENGLDPEPVETMSDGEWTSWSFDAPDANVFEFSFDARLEPAVQWKRPGTTRLLIDDRVVAEVSYTMWVMP
jgi:hypothetical protein